MIRRELFASGIDEYRPVTMWFWNDAIDEMEIGRQIGIFAEQRIYEFFIHPLNGFEEKYLSDRFFDLIAVAVRHAAELGMKCWIYDEYNWPSGSAGGKLIAENPDLRMVVVRHRSGIAFPGQDVSIRFPGRFLSAQAICGPEIRDIGSEAEIDVGSGTFAWRNRGTHGCTLIVFSEERQGGVFASGQMSPESRYQEGYLDTLNPEAVRRFLDSTHERYYGRLGEYFGSTIPGLFTDEVNLSSVFDFRADTIPWSKDFAQVFREANGYDLLPRMCELVAEVGDYRRTRHDYWRTLTERFAEAYAKQVADWCGERGIRLTGHASFEEFLIGDLLQSGSAFHSLRHYHVPGIDSTFSKQALDAEFFNVLGKMAASVAEHAGAARTLCETYTGSGWDLTVEEMKRIFHRLALLGVNMIQFMGAYYSLRGLRKQLPAGYPPSHSFQVPVWPYYGLFSDYVSRLCYAGSLGVHGAEIAVLQPTTMVWSEYALRYDYWVFTESYDRKPYKGDLDVAERTVHGVVNALLQLRRDFDLLHEPSLLEAETADGMLRFRGHAYRLLILPSLLTLTGEVWDKVSAFIAAGGRVLFVNLVPAHSPDRGDIAAEVERVTGLSPSAAAVEVGERFAAGAAKASRVAADNGAVSHIVTSELAQGDNAGFRGALERVMAWLEPKLSLGEACDHVYVQHRRHGDTDLFMVVNDKPIAYDGTIRLHRNGRVTVFDPQTGGAYEPACITGDGYEEIRLPLVGLQALLVEVADRQPSSLALTDFTGTGGEIAESGEGLDLSGEWAFAPNGGSNFLRLEVEVALAEPDGDEPRVWHKTPGNVFPAGAGFELGAVYEARAQFTVRQLPGRLELAIDPAEDEEIAVNGVPLKPIGTESVWDGSNVLYDLAEAVQSDGNMIRMRGRIPSWGAEHAPIFAVLRGTFGVGANREIAAMPERQQVPGDWTEQGYPDWSGQGVYRREIVLDAEQAAGRATLRIGPCRDVVELWCNGEAAGVSLWNPHRFDLTGRLRAGVNALELRVANTLANLLEKPVPSGLTGGVMLAMERTSVNGKGSKEDETG